MKRTRASGEVLEYLLLEFEVNQNPMPEQRKEISDRTGMSEKAVRIWFQNRRAKLRKLDRLKGSNNPSNGSNSMSVGMQSQDVPSYASSRSSLFSNIPTSANQVLEAHQSQLHLYNLVDCSSLSVGSWQRVKTGENNPSLVQSVENLAPFCVKQFMADVDLLVVLSRKNNEINYFFSAPTNDSKILFRVFYPVSSVLSCSLLDNNISKENNELRISLSHKPQFSVYFYNGVNAELNQWSICEDFSEGQQVSNAFYSPGGEKIPHVLVGVKQSLEILQMFLMENAQVAHSHVPFQSIPPAPVNTGAHKPLHLHDTHTPSQSSDIAYGQADSRIASNTKDYIDLPESSAGAKSDFQLKHDIQSWNGSTPGDINYDIKPEFEGSLSAKPSNRLLVPGSSRFDQAASDSIEPENYPEGQRKPEGAYNELFSETPDFFSAVQTPNNNLIASQHSQQENLIHSPSTNVHSYPASESGLKKGPEGRLSTPAPPSGRRMYGNSYSEYSEPITVNSSNYEETGQNHYGFDINMTDNYQDSPANSNAGATPNTVASTSHVDTFIDYNGNA